MSQPWYDYNWLQSNAYQTQYQGPGTDTPHFALDLQTPFHTPITSPIAGTVKVADYQGWGGEVFIQPKGGGPELYWYHLDQNAVHPGQQVTPGEFIGLSGGENPGYPGALHPTLPQYSSGPHTHFGEFTNWDNTGTPQGTVPYGPNPMWIINDLRGGVAINSVPGVSPQSQGSAGIPNNPQAAQLPSFSLFPATSGLSASVCQGFDPLCWISQGLFGGVEASVQNTVFPYFTRILFGLLGGALIIAGVVVFIGKEGTVINIAKKATKAVEV